MNESLVKALVVLDRFDAEGGFDGDDGLDLVEAVHREIARGLGLSVFPPSNYPYTTVSDRPDANPYSRERDEVWQMPDYTGDFEAAIALAPAGAMLNLLQEGTGWRAGYKLSGYVQVGRDAWRESRSPVRAIARAALAARLGI